jgi:hypothetical protein
MPTTINASNTSGGAVVTGDGSGILELQSGGVTGITVNGANVTVAGTLTATGGIPQIAASLTSPLAIIGNSTAGAEIRLPEDTDNGSNYVALKAANALAANLTLTLPAADGTNGQVLQTNGSGTLSFATAAAASVQEFTSSGTWTKPTGANFVMIECWGAGGGGGSGPKFDNSTYYGGSGGGGAAYVSRTFIASELSSTVSVTIGAGGAGGAAITTANTNGANGVSGGDTTFGSFVTAFGGERGLAGSSSQSNGGLAASLFNSGVSGAIFENNFSFGGGVRAASSSNGAGGWGGGPGGAGLALSTSIPGGNSAYGGGGGGGGGGQDNGVPASRGGGAGGGRVSPGSGLNGSGAAAGTTPGANGSSGTSIGQGGGGGAAAPRTANIAAGNGGNGGAASGGGGGGAAVANGTGASGAGGTGGNGLVRVYTW